MDPNNPAVNGNTKRNYGAMSQKPETKKVDEEPVVEENASDVEKTEPGAIKPVEKAVVTPHKLYIREKADRKAKRVTTVGRGDVLTIVAAAGKDWLKVSINEHEGFVMKQFVKEAK